MTPDEAARAARVLRENAPKYDHATRRASFAAAKLITSLAAVGEVAKAAGVHMSEGKGLTTLPTNVTGPLKVGGLPPAGKHDHTVDTPCPWKCPDDGTCHHYCNQYPGEQCWRVHNAEPLTGVFPEDEWPKNAKPIVPEV